MDRLDAMKLFVAVVDHGGFSAAARVVGMPVATVSRRIGELEAHLQARLLMRSTRKLALTDAGRDYLGGCRRILDEVGELERAATGELSQPKGELVVTAPVVFGRMHVQPVILSFLNAFPDIRIRLVLSDRVAHLLEEHIDAAIRIGPLPDSNMVAIRLGQIRQVCCASPDYLARHGIPAVPADLAQHTSINYDGLYLPQRWQFGVGSQSEEIGMRCRLSVNSAEAAIEAAIAGLGLTRVLSYQCAPAVAEGRLSLVLESFEPAPWPVHLLHGGQAYMPQKLRAFIDWMVPGIRARLAE
ncbi:LysR family transcriptional regulator [Burkholderiaceae bacterium DAT-1]|nr:LysR family transcriptional regulator [Burkholderiaceae bacterium DAT-1]